MLDANHPERLDELQKKEYKSQIKGIWLMAFCFMNRDWSNETVISLSWVDLKSVFFHRIDVKSLTKVIAP